MLFAMPGLGGEADAFFAIVLLIGFVGVVGSGVLALVGLSRCSIFASSFSVLMSIPAGVLFAPWRVFSAARDDVEDPFLGSFRVFAVVWSVVAAVGVVALLRALLVRRYAGRHDEISV